MYGITSLRFSPTFMACTPCVHPLMTRFRRNSIGLPSLVLESNMVPSTR